jgi:ketosteroid isomerase-like protein
MSASVEVVRGVYAGFLRGDIPGVLRLLAEDVEWSVPGSAQVPHAGRRRGPGEVGQFFADVGGGLDVQQFEPREFFDAGESVFVLGRARVRAKSTGRGYETEWLHHWKARDGKITYFREYADTAAVNAAFA